MPDMEDELPESCYDRAIAAIKGTPTSTPNMGLEWRLVPVGTTLEAPSPRASVLAPGDPALRACLERLPTRGRHALRLAGITTVAQIQAMTDPELLALPGVGWGTVTTLRAALAQPGGVGNDRPRDTTT